VRMSAELYHKLTERIGVDWGVESDRRADTRT
jgi:hypothetical protein